MNDGENTTDTSFMHSGQLSHLAQFYSTIKCVQMAINNNEYDIIIKARSNMRFEKGLAKALPNNLDIGVIPVLQRQPRAWNHFQQPSSDDRPDTKWDNWPECINDVSVFGKDKTYSSNSSYVDMLVDIKGYV